MTPEKIRYETVYETVFDGTDNAAWGRTLRPYVPPPPVVLRPKQFLIVDDAPAPKARRESPPRTFAPPRHAGPVYQNRHRIWGLLRRPMAVGEIVAATGVPQHALSTALTLLHQAGGLKVVGKQITSVGRCPNRYQRADAYKDAPTWPLIPRRRKQATP